MNLFEKIFKGFYDKDLSYDNQYPTVFKDMEPGYRLQYQDYAKFMQINMDRKLAYKDFEEMDFDIVASALDLMADDATQYNLEDGKTLYIECADKDVERELNHLFFDILEIDEHVWDIVRMTAKYGDFFLKIYGEDKQGIQYCDYSIHPTRVTRIDSMGTIKNFIVDDNLVLAPWSFVHFRLPGSVNRRDQVEDVVHSEEELSQQYNITYGIACLYRARRVWKQLKLLEDSMVLCRLARGMKRNIFMVNTAGLKEPQAWDLVDKINSLLKKNRSMNMSSNSMVSQSIMVNPDEDIVIPVNNEKGTLSVQELGGDPNIQHIADIDYMTNKLFAALKIPKAFLGFEDSLNGRNTLRMLDVRYARTIKNLQRVLIVGLERIARIHLSYIGRDPYGYDFKITLPYISTIEESEKMEAFGAKADAVEKLTQLINDLDSEDKYIDRPELIKKIFQDFLGFTSDDMNVLVKNNTRATDVSNASFETDVNER